MTKKITPFLWFNDDALEAAKFYVKIFRRSKITSVMKSNGKVMSVTFRLEGQDFMALNGGPTYKLTPAISLFVDCKDQREVDALWKKLARGGAESRCGWLEDKFGLSWQIIPKRLLQLLSDKDPKRAHGAMTAMLKMAKIDVEGLERGANAA